ncbi:MAG: hypothetical protein AAFV19_19095, partial [Pseudomonadota bacterium]
APFGRGRRTGKRDSGKRGRKGGCLDIAEQKKQLKQEIAAARANGGNDCAFASIFGMMFGHDGDAATASVPASTAAN